MSNKYYNCQFNY